MADGSFHQVKLVPNLVSSGSHQSVREQVMTLSCPPIWEEIPSGTSPVPGFLQGEAKEKEKGKAHRSSNEMITGMRGVAASDTEGKNKSAICERE